VVLADGDGLDGGTGDPTSALLPTFNGAGPTVPDHFALVELSNDVRPPRYAAEFARRAALESGLPISVVIAAVARPPWLRAVIEAPGVALASVAQGIAMFST
jgi:hypothetical protein